MKNATIARFIGLAMLWGSSFSLIRVSLESLTPGQLVLARLILGAVVLLLIAAFSKVGLPKDAGTWGHYAGAALFGNVIPFLLLSYGEKSTNAGIAGVLIGATPLITMMIAAAALPAERATSRKVVGLVVGFVGVVLVIGPWTTSMGSLGARIACFGAALSYAVGFVYVRKYLSPKGLAPLAGAASQLVAAAVLQGIATPFLAWHAVHFNDRSLAAIIFLGLFSTGLAYTFYFALIGDVGATTASAVNYVVPVFAVLIGAILLGESITWNLVVGGLVVLAGVAYAENRVKRARKDEAPAPAPQPVAAADRGGAAGEAS
jgi:drug/metabolite transporter (DMT)-like permease